MSDDLAVQARYETARRALDEILEQRKLGHDVQADCKTLQVLFVKELRRLEAPPARALAKEISAVCQIEDPARRRSP